MAEPGGDEPPRSDTPHRTESPGAQRQDSRSVQTQPWLAVDVSRRGEGRLFATGEANERQRWTVSLADSVAVDHGQSRGVRGAELRLLPGRGRRRVCDQVPALDRACANGQ